MRIVERIYIEGAFVTPHGTEMFDLFDPARGEVIGQVRLADADLEGAVPMAIATGFQNRAVRRPALGEGGWSRDLCQAARHRARRSDAANSRLWRRRIDHDRDVDGVRFWPGLVA
jgi:acyl-CoA reductase-like NAD-dependent aldehyde dehydrogenase